MFISIFSFSMIWSFLLWHCRNQFVMPVHHLKLIIERHVLASAATPTRGGEAEVSPCRYRPATRPTGATHRHPLLAPRGRQLRAALVSPCSPWVYLLSVCGGLRGRYLAGCWQAEQAWVEGPGDPRWYCSAVPSLLPEGARMRSDVWGWLMTQHILSTGILCLAAIE